MTSLPQRITQLQCYQMNKQLQLIFISWITQNCKYFPGIINNYHYELQLIIGIINYTLTIAQQLPQAGDYLKNITYKKMTIYQKIFYFIGTIILPYIIKRMKLIKKFDKINEIIIQFDKVWMMIQFINSALFIAYGQYRTILQRILKMKMQFIQNGSLRILNYSLMNRRLIWQIYELFLRNILPQAYKLFGSTLKDIFYLQSFMNPNQSYTFCIKCEKQHPVLPRKAQPCQHLICNYCFEIQNKNITKCPKCLSQIKQWYKLYQ